MTLEIDYQLYIKPEKNQILIGEGVEGKVIEIKLLYKEQEQSKLNYDAIRKIQEIPSLKFLIPQESIIRDKKELVGYLKVDCRQDDNELLDSIVSMNTLGVYHCDVNDRNIVDGFLVDNGLICLKDQFKGDKIDKKFLPFINPFSDKIDLFGFYKYYYNKHVINNKDISRILINKDLINIDFHDDYDVVLDKIKRLIKDVDLNHNSDKSLLKRLFNNEKDCDILQTNIRKPVLIIIILNFIIHLVNLPLFIYLFVVTMSVERHDGGVGDVEKSHSKSSESMILSWIYASSIIFMFGTSIITRVYHVLLIVICNILGLLLCFFSIYHYDWWENTDNSSYSVMISGLVIALVSYFLNLIASYYIIFWSVEFKILLELKYRFLPI